jgi:drug/metabolite transporter (DMT)-like permease
MAGLSAEERNRSIRGIALMVCAGAAFCTSSVFVKQLGGDYSAFQVVFIRSLFVIAAAAVIAGRMGGFSALKTRNPWLHLGRGVFGFISVSLFFFAVTRLAIADAMTAAYCAPLFITALSVPLLGEAVGLRRWLAVGVGFTGVVLVAAPSGSVDPALAAAIGSALLYALVAILIRKMGASETMASVAFYTALIYLILGGAISALLWTPIAPGDLWLFAGVGVAGTVAQLLMTASYRAAPVAVVSPFEYTSFVWAILFDAVIFAVAPAWATLGGAAIIIASGLYILHREGVRHSRPVRRGSPRTPMGGTLNDPRAGRKDTSS